MSAKTMLGAQKRNVQPGGFTKPNRSRKGTGDVREAARKFWVKRLPVGYDR